MQIGQYPRQLGSSDVILHQLGTVFVANPEILTLSK